MPYRRVRSYQRRDARRDRSLPGQPRPGRVPMAALLAVALAAGIVTVSAPHVMAMLSAAGKPDGLGAAGNPEGLGAAGNLDELGAPGHAAARPEPCAAPAGD